LRNKKIQAFCLAVLLPSTFLLASAPAAASDPVGVNDVSFAMRYTADDRVIGTEVNGISNDDDSSVLVAAPWPMNFFGKKFTGLCLSSNGTVSPVVFEDTPDCYDGYDQSMESLTEGVAAPLIAVLANDNATDNTIRNYDYRIVNLQYNSSASTVTVTTSEPHNYNVSDVRDVFVVVPTWDNGNTDGVRADEYWFDGVSITAVTANTFTFSSASVDDARGSSISSPVYGSTSLETITHGWAWDDTRPNVDGLDDGVGKPGTIYAGTATVDGRDAWVFTNYRNSSYENASPKILTNTFQIVLVKRATPNGAVNGFDFDIEYNYGALMDGEDGYKFGTVEDECDSQTDECRSGVGLADWDPIAQQADVYELFGSTPSSNLVDWFTSGMTNNRLNSTINGRYTFAMVGGAVQGFATPVMDGTGTTTPRPGVANPLDPVPTAAAAPAAAVLATTGFDGSPLLLVAGILIAFGLVSLGLRKLVTSDASKK
jgi:hypothetical protein